MQGYFREGVFDHRPKISWLFLSGDCERRVSCRFVVPPIPSLGESPALAARSSSKLSFAAALLTSKQSLI